MGNLQVTVDGCVIPVQQDARIIFDNVTFQGTSTNQLHVVSHPDGTITLNVWSDGATVKRATLATTANTLAATTS